MSFNGINVVKKAFWKPLSVITNSVENRMKRENFKVMRDYMLSGSPINVKSLFSFFSPWKFVQCKNFIVYGKQVSHRYFIGENYAMDI